MDKKLRIISICFMIITNFHSSRAKTIVKRLIGGFEPEINEMKYAVGIAKDGRPSCSGGIIGEMHVITAAHCVVNSNTSQVTSAKIEILANSRSLLEVDPGRVHVEVDEVFLPIRRDGTHWRLSLDVTGDLAVLKLKERLSDRLGDNFVTLQLPELSKYNRFLHLVADVAGYGASKFQVITLPPDYQTKLVTLPEYKLLKSKALVIRNDICKHYYDSQGIILQDSHLCVRLLNYPFELDVPQGTCYGDSGAPLVIDGNVIIGIVQGLFHLADCDSNVAPAIFTKITSYFGFIVNAMKGKTDVNMFTMKVNYCS